MNYELRTKLLESLNKLQTLVNSASARNQDSFGNYSLELWGNFVEYTYDIIQILQLNNKNCQYNEKEVMEAFDLLLDNITVDAKKPFENQKKLLLDYIKQAKSKLQ